VANFNFVGTDLLSSFTQMNLTTASLVYSNSNFDLDNFVKTVGSNSVTVSTIDTAGNTFAGNVVTQILYGPSFFTGLLVNTTQNGLFDDGTITDLWNYVLAGDDTIKLGGVVENAFGDYANTPASGGLVCGDDSIILQLGVTFGGPQGAAVIYGDTIDVGATLGPVIFGDDIIDARLVTASSVGSTRPAYVGDSFAVSLNGFAQAGDDVILGSAQDERLFGDYVSAADNQQGGDDQLFGGGGEDQLIGGGGHDLLDGGAGADFMIGGQGDDTYVVDNVDDFVGESSNPLSGYDGVFSSISFTLGDGLEWLELTGDAAVNGTGNSADNILYGNGGNNTLDGRAGVDQMNGSSGNDTYIVDNVGDTVVEVPAIGGADRIYSYVSYTLSENVEQGRLFGTAVTLTGNDLNNSLTGNAAANTLIGLFGNDLFNGDLGNDVMIGGAGQDRFYFATQANSANNWDRILDFSAVDDSIYLKTAFFGAAGPAGVLTAAAFKAIGFAGAAAIDANDRIIHDRSTGKIYYDVNGSAAGGATLFAQVQAGAVLTQADFILYV
jgi:Ca2+-binding RTX toxin-like protein